VVGEWVFAYVKEGGGERRVGVYRWGKGRVAVDQAVRLGGVMYCRRAPWRELGNRKLMNTREGGLMPHIVKGCYSSS
jgi:hypothetical protein